MLSVVFILCENMLSTSLSLPLEQLRAAEALAQSNLSLKKRRQPGHPALKVTLASLSGEPIRSYTGLMLTPDQAIQDVREADIVYLPALWRNPKPILQKNRELMPWLRQQYRRGSIIAGVGTGCCFMAEAGLLDNKIATTHWHFFEQFQRWYPNIQLKREYFITQAGNLFCTGSVNSLADLTIHFIQQYFSRTIASHVERHFFHEIRRAYESPESYLESTKTHADEDIIQAQNWLNDHQETTINLAEVAQTFGMSVRNFNRRFKDAAGITPLKYLQSSRMETAKDLLKTTNLSIDEIMLKVGYHDTAHFSSLFKKHHDTTPGQYRTTVRAKLFSLEN